MFNRRDDLLPMFIHTGEIGEVYKSLQEAGPAAKLVEWGSGGSTVGWLFSLQPDQTFISIEHDIVWYDRVKNILDEQLFLEQQLNPDFNPNHFFYHIPKDGTPGPDVGQFDDDPGCEKYVNGPTDTNIWDADVFFVDGLARKWCAELVKEKATKETAVVFVHDYSSNANKYASLLELYPRHEIFTAPISRAGNHMLKLWLN